MPSIGGLSCSWGRLASGSAVVFLGGRRVFRQPAGRMLFTIGWGGASPMAEQSNDQSNPPVAPPSDEMVDEAGRESFPASDPPATWSGGDSRVEKIGDSA